MEQAADARLGLLDCAELDPGILTDVAQPEAERDNEQRQHELAAQEAEREPATHHRRRDGEGRPQRTSAPKARVNSASVPLTTIAPAASVAARGRVASVAPRMAARARLANASSERWPAIPTSRNEPFHSGTPTSGCGPSSRTRIETIAVTVIRP